VDSPPSHRCDAWVSHSVEWIRCANRSRAPLGGPLHPAHLGQGLLQAGGPVGRAARGVAAVRPAPHLRVVDQPRHQRLGGLRVVPGTVGLARPVIVMRPKLDLADAGDQPADPADRRDQLGDRVLGGDRVGQDGGVQHPPTSTPQHPGGLHHLADRLEEPPRPSRGLQPRPPVHQHGGVEPLVVQAQPAGDLPGDIAPQRADRLPVRQALQRLQHHHCGDHLGGHRRMPATLADQVGEQVCWEQLVTMVGKKGIPTRQGSGDGTRSPHPAGHRRRGVGSTCRQSAPSRPPARVPDRSSSGKGWLSSVRVPAASGG
jgi:hypothetical protein